MSSTLRVVPLWLGAVAGVLSGLLGIGGGLVIGPALALRGLPLPRATGTALAVVVPTACIAVLTEILHRPDQLHLLLALALVVGGQIGAHLGRAVLLRLPAQGLRMSFVLILFYAAARNSGLWGGFPGAFGGLVLELQVIDYVITVLLGIGAGVSAVLFGVGGGVVVVPGLVMLIEGMPLRDAMATSLLAMIPTAAVGLRIAMQQNRVIPSGLLRVLLPASIGAIVGVLLRNQALPTMRLNQVFAAFLFFVAWRLMYPPPSTD
ncbi:MAG: TSUP family transporter [Planctomycetes bacterium]|nr:TSUP family transporter [Planctomycetota bacterium]